MSFGVFGITRQTGFRIVESPHDKTIGVPSFAKNDAYGIKDGNLDPMAGITPPLDRSGIFREARGPEAVSAQRIGSLADLYVKAALHEKPAIEQEILGVLDVIAEHYNGAKLTIKSYKKRSDVTLDEWEAVRKVMDDTDKTFEALLSRHPLSEAILIKVIEANEGYRYFLEKHFLSEERKDLGSTSAEKLAEGIVKAGDLKKTLEVLDRFNANSDARARISEVTVQFIESIGSLEPQEIHSELHYNLCHIDDSLKLAETFNFSVTQLIRILSSLDQINFFDESSRNSDFFRLAELYPQIPVLDKKSRELVERLFVKWVDRFRMEIKSIYEQIKNHPGAGVGISRAAFNRSGEILQNPALSDAMRAKVEELRWSLQRYAGYHLREASGVTPDPGPVDHYLKAEEFAKRRDFRGVIAVLGQFEGNEETRKKIQELAIQFVESESNLPHVGNQGGGYNFYGLAEIYPNLSNERSRELVKGLFIDSINDMMEEVNRGIDRRKDFPSDERRKSLLQDSRLAQPMLKKARKLIKLV